MPAHELQVPVSVGLVTGGLGQGGSYVGMSNDWREDSPRGLLTDAQSFQLVAEDALCAHTKRAAEDSPFSEDSPYILKCDPPSLAIYYNFCHGIELALKAYIRQQNVLRLSKLRSRKFGHNISHLLDVAIEHGLCDECSLTETQIEHIHAISDSYSGKGLEYFRLGSIHLPPIVVIRDATRALVEGIRPMKLRLAGE
ncbi:MAG: hypothetical protein OXN89_04925 [Bryobacterales bacterium]|nr:hypothetical protein [Bryobacterales bacterium]